MKWNLLALAMMLALTAVAFQAPRRAPLPNFDRRTEQAPAATIAPAKTAAVNSLKSRVPQLQVTGSKVTKAPAFFSSNAGFLTGPNAEGGAVSATVARSIPETDPYRAVKAFLNEHSALLGYGADALSEARVDREYVDAHNGLRTVVWQQELNGVPVFEAITKGHITRNGELVNLYTQFVPDSSGAAVRGMKGKTALAAVSAPGISAEQAIVFGAQSLGDEVAVNALASQGQPEGLERKQTFRGTGGVKGDQYADLAWVPLDAQSMRLCWRTFVTSGSRSETFMLMVDAETGLVMVRRGLTQYLTNASYNVYTSDSPSPFSPGYSVPGNPAQPPIVSRTLVNNLVALNTNASPGGWIDNAVNETLGNNVDAHTDWDDDNQPDLPRPTGMPYHRFDFPLDLTMDNTNYRAAAVVNLFYWNNFMHDKLWELGFNEASGNFQTLNFNRGGKAGDAVLADGQDGAGAKDFFHVNNANMSTLPDGFPPRMQMYTFTGPDPDRDGDLDAEVMCHEYTHGLSHRLVGGGLGLSSLQPNGMGEGWSDFYALSLLSEPTDPLDGVYAAGGYVELDSGGNMFRDNYYFGIRRFPYSTNLLKSPLTFKDIDPTQISTHPGVPINPTSSLLPAEEVHNQGEVWCSILWEVRANFVAKYGTNGSHIALQLVTDGMKLSPPEPNFIQARDAILQADKVNNTNANYNELWMAFAKRGLGASATSPESDTTTGVVEAYDFPGLSILGVSINDTTLGNGNGVIDVNECLQLFVSVRNNSLTNAVNITAVLTSSTPNIVIVQDTVPIPNLPPNGVGRNLTPFRLYTTPGFICGTPIDLSFKITDFAPTLQTATNTVRVKTGFIGLNPVLLNNNTATAIPDGDTNGIDSPINVSGFSSAIGKLAVSLYLTHTFDSDLKIELIGPDGTIVKLADAGGGAGDNYGSACTPLGPRTTFDDNAPSSITAAAAPFIGSFRPVEPLDLFSGKSGAAVNGQWRLRVSDSTAPDAGTLQCWTLSLYPTVCSDAGGGCVPEISVSAVASPTPAFVGKDLTYTVTIPNTRAVAANSVVLTNVLPANVAFGSVTPSQGSCTIAGGVVRCNFGTVASGASATATIVVRPSSVGTLTNVFSIGSSAVDANPLNDTATVVTTVVEPQPALVAAGTLIAAESFVPATGGIEPGETVTVAFALRNTGTASTDNLIATLLEGNGVSAPDGPQSYGTVAVGGIAVRTFAFTASGASGSSILAALQLQDGTRNLGTVVFQFAVGGDQTFANSTPIVINALGAASPYPSMINVSGITGIVTKVSVTFTKLTHSFPDDIDALLVGPQGQKLILMSDAGGGASITNRTLTFDSSAADFLPNDSLISAGIYLPTDYVSGTEPSGDLFPGTPSGPLSSSLTVFNGINPNGNWALYINDDGGGDSGVMSGGWQLTISTVAPVNPVADLAVTATSSLSPTIVGEPSLLTLTITNQGPSNATAVVLTDVLPGQIEYANVSVSQGTVNVAAGIITASLGAISNGGFATVTIQFAANSSGLRTNSAIVSALSTDLHATDNVLNTVIVSANPSADLALRVVAAPDPVSVSSNVTFSALVLNGGPNHADFVRVTGSLASSLAVLSATSTAGACSFSDGTVICSIGRMEPNATATITIVATALSAGSAANPFVLEQIFPEPAPGNNSTNVVIAINAPSPSIVSAGAALVSESAVPPNNSLDSGEAVTISFALRNVGTADTGNLIASLQEGGGVSFPSDPQTFGAVVAHGPTVSRSFNFLVTGGPGTPLTATFKLQDGAQDLGTVTFPFTVSGTASGANNAAIVIPSQGQADTYPSTITISGVTGSVSKVTVSIRQLSHTFPEDIDMLLVGPAGQKVLLMSDAGAGNPISNATLTFDDSASALPFASVIGSGTYHPTDYAPADIFPAPAPAGPYSTNLSSFTGSNPNGTWSLFVLDDAASDSGRIDGGWALNFVTASPVVAPADIAVLATAPVTIESGASFDYSVVVTNYGPGSATGVTLADSLPAGFALAGVSVSQGSYSTASGSVFANLGNIDAGSGATVRITGAANAFGSLTNSSAASASQADQNFGNNSALTLTSITPPSLRIRILSGNAVIAWLSPGYVLESSANATGPFAASGASVITVNGTNVVTIPALNTQFYRLRKP